MRTMSTRHQTRSAVLRGTRVLAVILAAGLMPAAAGQGAPILVFESSGVLEFGYVPVAGIAERDVTVVNFGTASAQGTVTTSEPFFIQSGATFNIGPGETHTVTVCVEPDTEGTFTAAVTFSGEPPLEAIAQVTTILPDLEIISENIGSLGYFGFIADSVPDVTGDNLAEIVITDFAIGDPSQFGKSLTDRYGADEKGFPVSSVSVDLYNGSTGMRLRSFAPPQSPDLFSFGLGVAGLDDVSGDGRGDVAIVSQSFGGSEPEAKGVDEITEIHVYNGVTAELLHTITAPSTGFLATTFRVPMAAIGDLNGNGTGDIVLGQPVDPFSGGFKGGSASGLVHVFDGGTGDLIHTLAAPINDPPGLFGIDVTPVPDVNGDGIPDIAVASVDAFAFFKGEPVAAIGAYLYSGADGSLLRRIVLPPGTVTFLSGLALNSSIAGLDDVDGDGRGDIAIVTAGEDISFKQGGIEGPEVSVFSGATGELVYNYRPATPALSYIPFPYSVVSLGDFNGDGRGDFAVGLFALDVFLSDFSLVGRVDVVNGSGGSLLHSLSSPVPGDGTNLLFGFGLHAFDDVSGDGVRDIGVALFEDEFLLKGITSSRILIYHSTQMAGGVAVSPGTLDLGVVPINATETGEMRITNNTTVQLQGSIQATPPFSVQSSSTYNLAPGTSQIVRIGFTPTGAQAFQGTVTFTDTQTVQASLRGRGVAATGTVAGTVMAADPNDSLDCVTVLVESIPGKGLAAVEYEFVAVPDASGAYRIEGVPSGAALLRAFSPGFVVGVRELEVAGGGTTTWNFVLQRNTQPINLTGKVREMTASTAVGGIRVDAAVEGPGGDTLFTTFTCVDGSYELSLENLKAPVRVTIGGGDFTPVQTNFGNIDPNETVNQDFGLVLASGMPGALNGVVTDAANGSAVAGAQVVATRNAHAYQGTTAANGAYSIQGMAPGLYRIRVAAQGLPEETRTISVFGGDPATQLNFQLGAQGRNGCGSLAGTDSAGGVRGDLLAALLVIAVLAAAGRRQRGVSR